MVLPHEIPHVMQHCNSLFLKQVNYNSLSFFAALAIYVCSYIPIHHTTFPLILFNMLRKGKCLSYNKTLQTGETLNVRGIRR